MGALSHWPSDSPPRAFPTTFSLASAQGGLIADIFQRGQQTVAALLSYDPLAPIGLQIGPAHSSAPGPFPTLVPLDLHAQLSNPAAAAATK